MLNPQEGRVHYGRSTLVARARVAHIMWRVGVGLDALIGVGLASDSLSGHARLMLVIFAAFVATISVSEYGLWRQFVGHTDTARDFCKRILQARHPEPYSNYLWTQSYGDPKGPRGGARCKVCEEEGPDPSTVSHRPYCPVKYAEDTALGLGAGVNKKAATK